MHSLNQEWDFLPSNIKDIYSTENGTRKELGELIKRPDLAKTLEDIANSNSSVFYDDSNISRSIEETVRVSGGILTAEDMTGYQVKMEEPCQATFNGELVSFLLKGECICPPCLHFAPPPRAFVLQLAKGTIIKRYDMCHESCTHLCYSFT